MVAIPPASRAHTRTVLRVWVDGSRPWTLAVKGAIGLVDLGRLERSVAEADDERAQWTGLLERVHFLERLRWSFGQIGQVLGQGSHEETGTQTLWRELERPNDMTIMDRELIKILTKKPTQGAP